MSRRRRTPIALVLLLGGACVPDDQRTETVDTEVRTEIPAPVVAQLDSGSTAYKARDFAAAEAHYRRATELGPDVAAAWFGLYMVAHRDGRLDSAAVYLERAQELVPGASLLHPTDADTVP